MITTEDFFELKASNFAELDAALQKHPSVKLVEKQLDKTVVYMKEPILANELNQYLFENNIVLEHLVKRNNSLEEEFIKLISNS